MFKDNLQLVYEFHGESWIDVAYFDDDKVALISKKKSTISIYSGSDIILLILSLIFYILSRHLSYPF